MTYLFCPAKILWKNVVMIDFANDKVSFLDQNVDKLLTSSGHYTVPISRTEQLLDNMDNTVDSEKVFFDNKYLWSKSSDEKNKTAKNQVTTSITYKIEDIVYYKHKDTNKWKGPGKVIGRF